MNFSGEFDPGIYAGGSPFFVWIIPEGDGIIRLGVIAKKWMQRVRESDRRRRDKR